MSLETGLARRVVPMVTVGIDNVFMAAANSSGAEVMEKTPLVH